MQGKGSKVGQGYKFSSVASRFKKQLAELMEALHRMEPHYIRCIKPNSRNRCADIRHHATHQCPLLMGPLLCEMQLAEQERGDCSFVWWLGPNLLHHLGAHLGLGCAGRRSLRR